VIQPGEQILTTTTMKLQPQGTEQELECVHEREMEAESHYSSPISCDCIYPPLLFV